MRIVRFLSRGRTRYGILDEGIVRGLRGNIFKRIKVPGKDFVFDGSVYELSDVKLLAPCQPSKIICLGLNYRSHAEETKLPIPSVPLIFLKPPSAVIGPDAAIVLPRGSRRVDYEGELGIVVARKAKDVSVDEVQDYILGYTCFNDVSERYNQRDDGQWTRAKGYDTFAPVGPWIETQLASENVRVETYLNGELRQSGRTSDLIFGIPEVVSFVSSVMTLLPGDIIATGTPSGIGRMSEGDVVEIKIDGIGTLRNTVEAV